MPRPFTALVAALLLAAVPALPAAAQPVPAEPEVPVARRSPAKAFAYSLVLPGLGHRHAQGGSWRGAATLHALADVALWTGLGTTLWRRDQVEESFVTLAADQAGADVDGKNRTFFINLATYRSSDDFREAKLRARAWDQVGYVDDPAFQWAWQSEDAFVTYRDLRGDFESLGRRRSVLVGVLVANRLLSGLTAARAARRANRAAEAEVALAPPPRGEAWPVVELTVRY